MAAPGFQSEEVERRFAAYDGEMRVRLLELRALIFETAAETEGVGPIEESLKWNEPSYLPSGTGSGTAVRINAHKKSDREYGLYVNCRTDLLDRYRALYADRLRFEGNRAVLLHTGEDLPVGALKHCIAMAFAYRRR